MRIHDGSLADLTIDASFQVDPLSSVMVGFVTVVGFLIHVYSIGYMHGDERPGLRPLLRLPQPLHLRRC